MTKRHIELPPTVQATIDETIADVDEKLSSSDETAAAVQEILADLFGDWDALQRARAGESLPPMTRARIESYDPRNAFTEAERWAEQDLGDLRESKCLQYLWRCFDQSPLANNVAFALPFRQVLADHLFAEAGENLRLFGGIKIQCGHNIEMGDNVVVHNDVLLDDRGELVIGDRVSIADRAHIHTHSHDTVDQSDVTTFRTIIDDDVRLGFDAMIDAGVRVREDAMVGASSMVRGDVPAHLIAVGSPAKTVKIKPGWETVAEAPGPLPDYREDRALVDEFADDLEPFDEFGRQWTTPASAD